MPLEERDELDLLAFRYVAGEMIPEEALAFESRLADEQELREAVSGAVALADCLWESRAPHLEQAPIPQAKRSAGRLIRESLRSRKVIGLALSIAALLVLAVGVGAWLGNPLTVGKPIVAWLDGSGDQSSALRPGDRIQQVNRTAAVRFQNGVRLSASDDADVEVVSGTAVRLHSGRIQVDVGESGTGFAVLTESTRVVDLGTVFGVGVNASRETDVVVFQGEVELNPQIHQQVSSTPAERNLNTGEAVRVQSNGDRARIPMIWHDAANLQWSTVAADRGSSLIDAVSDNLATDSRPKFYAIVPRGFREDAQVFGDRLYEWNGLSAAGLPRELIGADYIRTFNDDKAQKDLEITVTLTGPADVYVLIDERYAVPKWLAADFALTDLNVGIDLGTASGNDDHTVPPLGINVKRWLGVGPGKSVDVPVSIWKRAVRDTRQIRLGPVPAETLPAGRGQMYGIVVTPQSSIPNGRRLA